MTEKNERFEVTNDSQLNWALGKYKEHKIQFDEYDIQAEESRKILEEKYNSELYGIEQRRLKLQAEEQKEMDYFKGLAEQYYLTLETKNPKKTINGSVRFSKKENVSYDDNLLSELKEKGLNRFISVKTKTIESVDKKALKAFVKDGGQLMSEDGEIVEGFKFDKTEEFTVKV
ncbi:host-nuclease inhibitor Gam family protein [Lactococcus kimchii]|uniref:host-nuclease inhibitor Gam family protein n=1 Tax=Lactococcus sp. S-13 TaxID=2507158 RepID=UPI0010233C32|nr:host-nuclease inhibitor Gam family protein [Lactococcus sp. S-13]RZI47991.1 hypothetical protein EQJ87_00170 [Lactococcus sp. S-13]RZI49823.1 hypothetical protein EQJ87_10520 [Lactococcus sp. S-13]